MKSFVNKILIFVAVMAVVGGAGWFGRKAYKKTMERRLVAEAKHYIDKKDFHNASLSLQRALELNPVSVSASEAMADMLETAGNPAALNWQMRAAKLDPSNANKRLHWAELAIKANDLNSATEALNGLDAKSKTTADYYKLEGALAWSIHDMHAAETNYLEAARLEPANASVQMNLATIHMTSTNEAVAQAGRAAMEAVATNADLRIGALHQLLGDAINHKSLKRAEFYSAQIAKSPQALAEDKVEYLELLRQNQNAEYSTWLAALEKNAQTSAGDAFALARWKVVTSGPANALHWIASLPRQTQTNLPVPLVMTDCQIALKDWRAILSEVTQQDWAAANYYKLALESLAERSLSQSAAADVSWHRAFRLSAHRLDRLTRLAEVTDVWQWKAERVDVLSEIIDEFPQEHWALDQLSTQWYAEGKTAEMESLFFKVYSKDPTNPRYKNNLANLYLLRKTELDKACEMAKEAYDSSTNNPFFASTYAYALLLQDKKTEALDVANGVKAEYLKIPSVALYYGLVQAQSGRLEVAREALKRAQAGHLLPEEKAIMQVAESKM